MRMEAGLVGTQRCRLCFYSSCITGPKQSHVKCFRVPHVWLIEVDFPGYLLVSTSTLVRVSLALTSASALPPAGLLARIAMKIPRRDPDACPLA